jgi:hypothetical protein
MVRGQYRTVTSGFGLRASGRNLKPAACRRVLTATRHATSYRLPPTSYLRHATATLSVTHTVAARRGRKIRRNRAHARHVGCFLKHRTARAPSGHGRNSPSAKVAVRATSNDDAAPLFLYAAAVSYDGRPKGRHYVRRTTHSVRRTRVKSPQYENTNSLWSRCTPLGD